MKMSVRALLVSLLAVLILSVPAMSSPCPAIDISGDCAIDINDLMVMAEQWLDPTCSGPTCADLIGADGVNGVDFALLSQNWLAKGYPIVINEFMSKNDTTVKDSYGQNDDWIEIYNTSNVPVDIGGIYITDGVAPGPQIPTNDPASTTIQPGGHLIIWADDGGPFGSNQGTLHVDFKLSAGAVPAETIVLRDPDQNIIDQVTTVPLLSDESYGRTADGAGTWQTFTTATTAPSPGTSNGSALADIIITEIMYHPSTATDNDFEEYIEIYNRGTVAANLINYKFTDGVDFTFPNRVINPGEYLVIASDIARFNTKYPTVTNAIGGWVGKLSNKGEKVELSTSSDILMDAVRYADDGDWGRRQLGILDLGHRGWEWANDHDGDGYSLELMNMAFSNNQGQNWKASTTLNGTPGAANSVASGNIAPVILNAKHKPAIPTSTDAVVVTVDIKDELTTGLTVTLYYRKDISTYSSAVYPTYVANYTTVAMTDGGTGVDKTALDSEYSAQIPVQTDGSIIEFFVEATDGTNSRTWPAPSDIDGTPQQVTNMLYQVNDSYDPTPAAGSKPVYYFVMTNDENLRLKDLGTGGDVQSNALMNMTFISTDGVDTKTSYNTGVRNRGQSTRSGPPNNYRVNFRHDDDWKNVTEITINYSYSYSQAIGNTIFNLAGLVTPNSQLVDIRVNAQNIADTGSLMYGSYVHNETFGGNFVDNHFPEDNDGNLYKAAMWDPAHPRPSDWVSGLHYEGTDPANYLATGYSKQTNDEYNDWSDFINLTNVLENEPDATYVAQVEAAVDVDQWMRWFAVNNLIGNNETSLGNGRGDDYRLYIGAISGKAELIVHDMDTVLGMGDSPNGTDDDIFRAADNFHLPVIERFLKHNAFAPRYYAAVKDVAQTVFAAENFDPVVDATLTGKVPQMVIDNIKQFAVDRVTDVITQIPVDLTATSTLPLNGALYTTTLNSGTLSGQFDAIKTRTVTVNDYAAVVNGHTATWSFNIATDGLTLEPGINRLIVESFDENTELIESEPIDVWYNDGTAATSISGTLASNTTLTMASSPWQVTSNITIPAGITLTIEPGASVYFNSGTRITINGQMIAEGTKYERIRLSRVPGTSTTWSGLYFSNTLSDNRLSYLDMDYGVSAAQSISVSYAKLHLDNVTWPNSSSRALELTHASFKATNCLFHGINGEVIHGNDIVGSEYFILENNLFLRGHTGGDIIDFTGAERPGPVFQVMNNIFMGGPDDGIDLDGTDAHVEGNIFMDFHKETSRNTTSNGIATGLPQSGATNRTEIFAVRNLFYGNDHGILFKEEAHGTIVNNTFVGNNMAAIQFNEIGGTANLGPSNGALIDGNIFYDNAKVFKNQFSPDLGQYPDPVIDVDRTIIDPNLHYLGFDNIDVDPAFIDADSQDFNLRSYSPAIGNGPNARDMGAFVIGGATVTGEPDTITHRTTATLDVDGPAITHYTYSLVDNGTPGAWSAEFATGTDIALSGLLDGHTYHVLTRGRNIDYIYPGDVAGNPSKEWTVDITDSKLLINEVQASSTADYSDKIELYYDGVSSLDLADYSITDDLANPRKYVFASQAIAADSYVVLIADPNIATGSTGFSLDEDGESVYLYNSLANGGGLIDSVTFGEQLGDLSIGRIGDDRLWTLNTPSLGSANIAHPLDSPAAIKINEWLADGQVLFADDWVELYNPGNQPVNLGGLYITDDVATYPMRHQIAPLSFIRPKGYHVLAADSDPEKGAKHLNFNLSSDQEMIALLDGEFREIDKVVYFSQTTDISIGRSPDGGDDFSFYDLPTPGALNMLRLVDVSVTSDPIFPLVTSWSYYQNGDPGATWKDVSFNDSAWPTGNAALYVENSGLAVAKSTPLTLGQSAYYFRKHFTIDDPNNVTDLHADAFIDDGATFYINGVEVLRHGMAEGSAITHGTWTNRTIDNAGEESIQLPADALVEGDNVIAVEVHQTNSGSSDIVFAMSLNAVNTVVTVTEIDPYIEDRKVLNSLRITEIMYAPSTLNMEYIKLTNIGAETIDLTAVRFTDGIDFTFPAMTLAPGQNTFVALNEVLLESYYPGLDAAGSYTGALNNGGEQIVLKLAEPLNAAILRFNYSENWYPTTDEGGDALGIVNVNAATNQWDNKDNWQAIATTLNIIGDLNDDGFVGIQDVRIMADEWATTGILADIAPDGGDEVVDLRDFAALAADWLQSI